MHSQADQPIQTLRLSERDKAQLLVQIAELSQRETESDQRRLRVACDHNDAVLSLLGQTGSVTRFAAVVRNISRWGVSIVLGRYAYPRTRCEVQVGAKDGTTHTRLGEVRYCRHIKGLVHELGVLFDHPVDLSEFTILSPNEETRHLQELADDAPAGEAEQVTELAYRVLVVDDYASDRKLYSHWLGRAGMTVSSVADSASARERVDETQFDLIIVDVRLSQESGEDLVRALRSAQFVAPILAVSADDTLSEATLIDAGANRYLNKPFNAETLVRTARELVGFDSEAQNTPIFSAFTGDKEMRPLLTEFTRGLSASMDKLREANARQDYETLEQIAHALKGAGSGYGFDTVTRHAEQLLFSLNDSAADIEKIKHSANELLCILNRVKLR
ncbi:MAG: response regulator [Phycisphaeraceae bacterium]